MCGALLAMHTLFVWLLHLSVFCLTCLSCIDYVVAIWSTISHTALVGANKRLNTNRNTIKSSAKDCTNQLASNCTEKHHTEKTMPEEAGSSLGMRMVTPTLMLMGGDTTILRTLKVWVCLSGQISNQQYISLKCHLRYTYLLSPYLVRIRFHPKSSKTQAAGANWCLSEENA